MIALSSLLRPFFSLLLCAGALAVQPGFAAPGDLDATFGSNGKTNSPLGPYSFETGQSLFVHTDGKIIVSGRHNLSGASSADSFVMRFNSIGTVDRTLAGDGSIKFPYSSLTTSPTFVAVQTDGKMVIAGEVLQADRRHIGLRRFNTNGSVDTTFGTAGSVVTTVRDSEWINALAIQGDGKIVVAGSATPAGQTAHIMLVRYNTNGSLDTTFGTGGSVVTVAGLSSEARDFAFQADGKIVVTGHAAATASNSDLLTLRYTAGGVLDTTFGTNGLMSTDLQTVDFGQSIAVQSDGKIVVTGSTAGSGAYSLFVARYQTNGALDGTFGTGGVASTNLYDGNELANSVALQTDGRILVAGSAVSGATQRAILLRYTTAGVLDTTFGSEGSVITNGSYAQSWSNVALLSDGKILTLGSGSGNEGEDIVLGRYTTAGQTDTSFGSGGFLITDILRSYDNSGQAIAQAPDGKIYMAGSSHNGDNSDLSLARYTNQGVRDSAFGTNGRITLLGSATEEYGYGIAVQSDGAVLVAGDIHNGANTDFLVVRYAANTTGSPDPTFNTSGRRQTAVGAGNDRARAVAVRPDGRILVAGFASNGTNDDFAIVAYNSDGALDASFGGTGIVMTPIGAGTDQATSLIIQPDGKVLVAGLSFNGFNTDFAIVRYTTSGALDPEFGTGGKVVTSVGSDIDVANGIALQADGKILVTGPARVTVNNDFALLRYLSNGTLDTTFGTGGKVVTAISNAEDTPYSVKVQNDGRILVSGTTRRNGTNDMIVVRYLADGTLDPIWGSSGAVITDIDGADYAYGLFVSGNRVVVGGSSTNANKTNFTLAGYANPLPPTVTTLPVTQAFGISAVLNATVNPNASATTASFEYGLTTSYGSTAAITLSPNNGVTDQQASVKVTGLSPNTTYHYRVIAANTVGSSEGADVAFLTAAASTNAELTGLLPGNGSLVPGFVAGVTEYTLDLPSDVTSLRVTPTTSHPNATVTIQNTPVVSGSLSQPINIPAGTSTIVTTVTAEDGVTTRTYQISVTRPASASATLSALAINPGALEQIFHPGWTDYTAKFGTQTAALTVTATAHANATIVINGTPAPNGTTSVPLNYGLNPIIIGVTSENGLVTSEYEISVTRAFPSPEINVLKSTPPALNDGGTLAFGNVGLGGQKDELLTITNTGTSDLTGITVTVDGANAPAFQVLSQPAAEIAPAANTAFVVRYTPPGIAPHTATLHITSNDADEGSFDIVLTASGVPPSPVFTVKALPATNITPLTATLKGSAASKGGNPYLFFDYGTTTAYGNTVTAQPAQIFDNTVAEATSSITGLQGHTKYYYRLRGTGRTGVAFSAPLSFTTLNRAPTPVADSLKVLPGAVVTLPVLTNDTDPDGDSLTVSANTAIPAVQGKIAKVNGNLVFTAAATFTGVSFSYTAKDAYTGTASATVYLTPGTSSIDPSSKTIVSAGETYEVAVTADGAWSVSEALTWVSATSTGSPGNGTVQITVLPHTAKAQRSGNIIIAGKTHTLTQTGVEAPQISQPPNVPAAIVSGTYSLAIPTVNPPVTYTVTNLPIGLTINQTNGIISGKPTKPGNYDVTVKARNAMAAAPLTVAFTIPVTELSPDLVGVFHGHVARDAAINGSVGSRFEMTTAATGLVTGKVITGVTAQAFSGKLDASIIDPDHPTFSASITRTGNTPLNLALTLDATTNTAAGTLSGLTVTAWRQVWRAVTRLATVYKGVHSFHLSPPDAEPDIPQGSGYATFTVDEKTGALKVSGKLADGSTLLTTTFVGPAGQVLIYQPLYTNKGSFLGQLTLAVDHSISGLPSWNKPAPALTSKDTIYRAGFDPVNYTAVGGPYFPPAAGGEVMNLSNTTSNARLAFTAGGLASPLSIIFDLLNPNATGITQKATFPTSNPNAMTLTTVNAATGAFTGTFTIFGATTAQHRKVTYQGQLVQDGAQMRGYGYFLLPEPATPPLTLATTPKHSGKIIMESSVP